MPLNWEANPDAATLATAGVGDIVHLKLVNAYTYLIKAIVSGTDAKEIEATVDAIFDWQNHGQLKSGDVHELVGKSLTFSPRFIHKVIKRT